MTDTAGVLHPSWHRVVLKLSGAAFSGDEPLGISPDVVAHIAEQIVAAVSEGTQVADANMPKWRPPLRTK